MKLLNRYPKRGDFIKRIYSSTDSSSFLQDRQVWILKILSNGKIYKNDPTYKEYKYKIIYCDTRDGLVSESGFIFKNSYDRDEYCKDYLMASDEVMVDLL